VPIRYPKRVVEIKGGRIMRLQVIKWLGRIGRSVRGVGPYAAVELILPGGSLIVLLILAVRHREALIARVRRALSGRGRKTEGASRMLSLGPIP
jgi:hypothetical protein